MSITTVPPGIYDVAKLITTPGVSPTDPHIYHSERPGGAVLIGGGIVRQPQAAVSQHEAGDSTLLDLMATFVIDGGLNVEFVRTKV